MQNVFTDPKYEKWHHLCQQATECQKTGDFQGQVWALNKAVAELRRLRNVDLLCRVITYDALGSAYLQDKNAEEALGWYTKSVDLLRVSPDSGARMELATSLNEQGKALIELGRHREALSTLNEATELYKQCLGLEHPYLAVVQISIVRAYRKLGKIDEAEHAILKVIQKLKTEEHEHRHYWAAMLEHADISSAKGDLATAENVMTAAIEGLKPSLSFKARREIQEQLADLRERLKDSGAGTKNAEFEEIKRLNLANRRWTPNSAK